MALSGHFSQRQAWKEGVKIKNDHLNYLSTYICRNYFLNGIQILCLKTCLAFRLYVLKTIFINFEQLQYSIIVNKKQVLHQLYFSKLQQKLLVIILKINFLTRIYRLAIKKDCSFALIFEEVEFFVNSNVRLRVHCSAGSM